MTNTQEAREAELFVQQYLVADYAELELDTGVDMEREIERRAGLHTHHPTPRTISHPHSGLEGRISRGRGMLRIIMMPMSLSYDESLPATT